MELGGQKVSIRVSDPAPEPQVEFEECPVAEIEALQEALAALPVSELTATSHQAGEVTVTGCAKNGAGMDSPDFESDIGPALDAAKELIGADAEVLAATFNWCPQTASFAIRFKIAEEVDAHD